MADVPTDLIELTPEYLAGVANRFKFPELRLANMIPKEYVDGDIATWDIYEESVELDADMVGRDSEAEGTSRLLRGKRSQQMPYTFKFADFPLDIFDKLRAPGSDQASARGNIAAEIETLKRNKCDLLDEYLLVKALTGTIPITLGGVSVNVDTEIPAGNKPTAAADWGTSTTDIISDIESWKDLIVKGCGREPKYALANNTVFIDLMKNDTVKNYLQGTPAGTDVIRRGVINELCGLMWLRFDHVYKSNGTATKFLPDDRVIFMPEPSVDWISMQVGQVTYPTGAESFTTVHGPAWWAKVVDSPTVCRVFVKYCRFPALKVPAAVVFGNTSGS